MYKAAPFLLLFAAFYLLLTTTPVRGFTMSNNNYILQMGNFNMAAGKVSSDTYNLGITAGETAIGLYSGTNYKVRSGFEYIHSIIRFAFTVSETLVDFGEIYPTSPVVRTNTLTVSNGSANGYIVTVSEDHELKTADNAHVIPDTTCDDGTCSETTASTWSNTLTYGFGYRCDKPTGLSDDDCSTDFSNSAYFKQFPNTSKGQTEQIVMTGRNVGRRKQVQVTYKVNISGTQAPGLYANTLTFIATPTF